MQGADDELAQLLAALCSPEKAPRTAAEQALAAGQLRPGFATRLAAFALAGPGGAEALPLRQMGLTALRRLTGEHWPALPEGDRAALRQALPAALAEPSSSLRGLLHACAANVRAREAWPELHARLQAGIAGGAPEEAGPCLECVGVLLEECGPEVAASLAPLQAPMLALAASEAAPPALRRECVGAHAAGVGAALAGGAAAAAGVLQDLPAWLAVHAALCAGREGWGDAERVACAFTAVRTVTSLSRLPPLADALAGGIEAVLRPACLLVQQIEPAYERAVVFSDDGGQSEEDGGVAQLIAQLMELLQSMLVKAKLRALLKGHMRSMLQLIVPFMRITEAQVKAWRADPNEFLAHEEDDYARGCQLRLSGEGLVGELTAHVKREGQRALALVVGELLGHGQSGLAEGQAHAWKLVEVALFLFACAAAEIQPRALQRGELGPLASSVLAAAARLCADSAVPEFLRARAFALLRKLGDAVCKLVPSDLPALLQAAAASLRPGEPLAVRVCACRALCRFLSAVDDTAFKEKLLLEGGVLASLGSLTQEADEELLHLLLESLCVVAKQCPGAVASAEAAVAPLILEVWRRCAADPLAHLQVLDLVSCAIASDPRLQLAMEEHLLPAVRSDLRPGTDAHLTASSIELFGVLLRRAAVPFRAPLWECAELLLQVVMRSDESGLMQNASEVLCCLAQRSPGQLSDSGCLQPLLQCVERLLGPSLDDDACLHVGQLAMLVLSQFGALLPVGLTVGLLRALVTRLAGAERPYLRQELVVVVARLLCQDLQGTLAALSGMALDGAPPRSGLEALLSAWLAMAGEIRARRARSVSVSALCRLHERCLEDAGLRALRLAGPPLEEQLLAALIAALELENERCGRMRAADLADSSEGGEVGEAEEDEEGEEGGGEGGRLLSELLEFDDDDELSDDGCVEEALLPQAADPFRDLDVRALAAQYLAAHAPCAAGRPELSERLRAAVEGARAQP